MIVMDRNLEYVSNPHSAPPRAKVVYLLNRDAALNSEPAATFLALLDEHRVTAGKIALWGIASARRAVLLSAGKVRPTAAEEQAIRARCERGPRAA